MATTDITSRPRRGLTAEERRELFREFKLGLFALAALVGLVVTLCSWSRGPGEVNAAAAARRAAEANKLVRVIWQPEAPRGEGPPAQRRAADEGARETGGGDVQREAEDAGAGEPVQEQRREQPPQPPPVPQYRNYTVRKGDISLRKIAAKTLGDADKYKLILEANPGLKPTRMRIGQILRIPVPGPAGGSLANGATRSSGGLTLQSQSPR